MQPFPLQTSSLFGGSTAVPPNPGPFGALGIGSAPRHVNIHIHAGMKNLLVFNILYFLWGIATIGRICV